MNRSQSSHRIEKVRRQKTKSCNRETVWLEDINFDNILCVDFHPLRKMKHFLFDRFRFLTIEDY